MIELGKRAPKFDLEGVQSGRIGRFTLDQCRGSWLVLFFYPRDFTFVCPTEIIGFQKTLPDFKAAGTVIRGVSVDDVQSHRRWAIELGDVDYPLLSDTACEVSRAYATYSEDEGVARRGIFIIDPSGLLQNFAIYHANVGRSVSETLRVVQALQTGLLCPEGWLPGGPTEDVSVGQY